MWQKLIKFAWNLKADQIIISDLVADMIVEEGEKLSEYFGNPIFLQKTNAYEKIARFSISFAILSFSFKGGKVIVTKECVRCVIDFLIQTFTKQSLGLNSWAKDKKKKQAQGHLAKGVAEILCKEYPGLDQILVKNNLKSLVLQNCLGIDSTDANKLLAQMFQEGILETGKFGYTVCTPVRNYIRDIMDADY